MWINNFSLENLLFSTPAFLPAIHPSSLNIHLLALEKQLNSSDMMSPVQHTPHSESFPGLSPVLLLLSAHICQHSPEHLTVFLGQQLRHILKGWASPTSAYPFTSDLIQGDRCWTLLPTMAFSELAECPFQICLCEKSFWTSGHLQFKHLPAASLLCLPTLIRNNNSDMLLIHLWCFHCFLTETAMPG